MGESTGGQGPVLRVAGGWVRDKLLKQQSDDIDIALDNCYGRDFALAAHSYYADYKMNHQERAKALGGKIGTAATIAANPSKSKHLETATVKMFGMEIDFVNLRAEDYADGTRIPSIRFGTAKEDADRRDLTINAMFYNINEGKIEDLTGRGLDDLELKLIRTPLDPITTFHDDPLRVLRSIRFATRFNFSFVDDVVSAGSMPEVHTALKDKVSRERVGAELAGMFRPGAFPLRAMQTLGEWNLFDSVFSLPEPHRWTPQSIGLGLALAKRTTAIAPALDVPVTSPHLTLAAVLCPWFGKVEVDAPKARGLVHSIVGTSIKWAARDAIVVQKVVDGAQAFREAFVTADAAGYDMDVMACVLSAKDEVHDTPAVTAARVARVELGHVMRACGEAWREALCLSVALDDVFGRGAPIGGAHRAAEDTDTVLREQAAVRANQVVDVYQLDRVWTVKPLLNGTVLMGLGVPKGPKLKQVIDEMMDRQLAFPAMTASDAKTHLGQ